MDKKEFVQRYVISLTNDIIINDDTINLFINEAIKVYDAIEKKFEVSPTKDLWDYNDRN